MNTNYIEKCETFRKDATERLFDICSCKYKCLSSCNCSKDRKVPSLEHSFLIDQRSSRQMIIGRIDQKITKKTHMVYNTNQQYCSKWAIKPDENYPTGKDP